ncbi:MAG TPA: hypothetical protein VD997_05905 [Phycisphaerales bacterium]|nr:hypothetical protein [Phycisphaerales bacterium]
MSKTAAIASPLWACSALLAAVAGLAVPCVAQDSVSRNSDGGSGLPGDALNPWNIGPGMRSNYVVDLREFRTSAGTTFGVAPIMKSGKTSAARFTALNGTSTISAAVKTGATPLASSYTLWSAAGGGLNTNENIASLNSTVQPPTQATVFGVGLMDFDEIVVGTSNVFVNQLYAGLAAFDPENPSRLYVTRIHAAANSTNGATDRSQLGLGAIDADGNLSFRADSFGSTGPAASLLVGDNYFRVRAPARGTTVNLIDNNGGSNGPATDWVLVRDPVTHTVPTAVPANLAGRPVVVGSDLLSNARTETSANAITSSTAHRTGTIDHRGAPSFTARTLFAGTVGTAGILTRGNSGAGKTDSISLWGVNTSGAPTATRTVSLPSSLTDPCIAYTWNLGNGDFRGYESQTIFRGGSGPVAITRDRQGRALVASVVYHGSIGGSANPLGAIAVARFDPTNANSPVTWSNAAWIDVSQTTGKQLFGDYGLDGAPGTNDTGEGDGVVDGNDASIGRLASLSENPFASAGPSISSPTFDAAGNLYFIASVSLKKRLGAQVLEVPSIALIRGLYNEASFCYSLEVVLEMGSVFAGRNSGTNYQVQVLNLSDADSASSASIWSGSATQQAWNNVDPTTMEPGDPRQLGGLVLSARVCYDMDGNSVFEDPSVLNNNPASADESYNVVMYVGYVPTPVVCGTADYNQDGDIGTDQDIEAFFACIGGNCCPTCQSADFNGDGDTATDQDIESFFRVLGGGPC